MQVQDVILLILFAIIGLYIAYRSFWMFKLQGNANSSTSTKEVLQAPHRRSDLERLIESEGYEIIQGTDRIPVEIRYGEKHVESHYTADLLVKKDNQIFVVKKKRKAERSSLSSVSIRRELFPLSLLYDADGVLYVDTNGGKVKEITFLFPKPFYSGGKRSWKAKLFWFVVGLFLGIAIVLSKQ
jgi:hypothetical protein